MTTVTIWGAVPESTPRTIAVGVDEDGTERDLSTDADGVVVALEVNPKLRADVAEGNLLARATVLGLTSMTDINLLDEVEE